MPLITITTTAEYQPANQPQYDTPKMAITASLGEHFPKMVVDNCERLGLHPDDTPLEGVQVDYKLYHPRVVNGADIWVVVQFAERPADNDWPLEIADDLRGLILDWFDDNGHEIPNIALDVFWGPDHGFFKFGDKSQSW